MWAKMTTMVRFLNETLPALIIIIVIKEHRIIIFSNNIYILMIITITY